MSITYDHSSQIARDPVRSPIYKLRSAGLVLESVTIWESPVLYVLLNAMDDLFMMVQ